MLVTFHSNAFENLTYFGDVAKQLLVFMGHSATIPGAIKAKDLDDALNQLQQRLAVNKDEKSNKDEDDSEPEISLAKRALPLVNMLKASIKADCDVLWDTK